MTLIDLTIPKNIRFHIESIEKTDFLRAKWTHLHKGIVNKTAQFSGEEKGYWPQDPIRKCIELEMPGFAQNYITEACNKFTKPLPETTNIPRLANLRKGQGIAEIGLGDPKDDPRLAQENIHTTSYTDPVMRPVDRKQKEIIYDFSFGRQSYLKARNKVAPENKYYFPETTSWDYGWRLKDSEYERRGPRFGRSCKFAKELKNLSGAQPDPPHYRSLDISKSDKCPRL